MAEVLCEAMDACKVREPSSDDIRHMYLDLLKRALCNLIYPENELRIMYAQARAAAKQPVDVNVLMDIRNRLKEKFRELYECRRDGRRTVSQYSHSMIGLRRMDNIQECSQNIFDDDVPGDFVETGVWRGGAVIFMRALLRVYGQENRLVWVADSFRGLPPPQLDQDAGYDFSKNLSLAIDLDTVKENFRRYNFLDDKVKFLEGWFEDTLPNAPIEKVALLRLDADLYKSTMNAMEALYDKVSVGEYVIIDDYGDLEPCRQAIDEFRDRRGITDPMIPVDCTGVYWRKGGEVNRSSITENGESLLIAQVEPPQREDGGDYYYRTYAPGIAMAQEDGVYVINLTNVHRKKEEIMREADVLVLNNICDQDFFPLIKERKEQKRLTVYELADDICAIPTWNPVHFFYKNQENLLLFKRLARYCDAMQFSVPELQRIYGYLNPSSVAFPNQISIVPPERKYEGRPEIIVGWGGSHGHLEDMVELAGHLTDWIISKDNVQLYLMCSDQIWKLFDRLPLTRKRRFEPGSLSDYYAFLRKLDIGLVPLKDTAFNRSRSDVKFLEYAVHGVVPVVQASVPYISTVKHGETGFLFEDTTEMLEILGTLAGNVNLISQAAKSARDYVIRERLQHQHGKERTEFYRMKLADLRNGHEVKNRARKIFDTFSNIEGATRYGRHLRLMPTRFENLLHDGLVLSQLEGKAASARSLFSEASRLGPNNYLPYLFGASCSGDPVASLQEAIKRNPRSLKAWILLGEEYAKNGDVVRTIECFEAAAKIFPEYEIPYLRTAAVLQKLRHQKESMCLTEKAEALTLPLRESG